jgi:3',5'-cyclic AMP phosphodiesterase CpdA
MTTRLKGVYVTFDREIREDDAEAVINAIRMVRGVADVAAIESNHDDYTARAQVRHELAAAIYEAYHDITDNGGKGMAALKASRESKQR